MGTIVLVAHGVLLVLAAGSLSCGSHASVPDISDAAPDTPDTGDVDADPCSCPAAESLAFEQISQASYSGTLGQSLGIGIPALCETDQVLIGGACAQEPVDSRVLLGWIGLDPVVLPQPSWRCYMENPTTLNRTLTTSAMCLSDQDLSGSQPPSECGCPTVEPLRDRIVRVTNTAVLAGNSSAMVAASCEPETVLIGGSCVTELNSDVFSWVTLSRAGMVPELSGTWLCGWNHPGEVSGTIKVTAICVTPPAEGTAPEAVPLAERITYVTEERLVPTLNVLSNSVACPAGDTLLMGGCMVDRANPQSDLVTMYEHGFEGNNPNAWRCGWNNPTTTSPTAYATAICLAPTDP